MFEVGPSRVLDVGFSVWGLFTTLHCLVVVLVLNSPCWQLSALRASGDFCAREVSVLSRIQHLIGRIMISGVYCPGRTGCVGVQRVMPGKVPD